MDADQDQTPDSGLWKSLGGYIALWFGLALLLGMLVFSGQLRQAEDAFRARAATIFRDVESRLIANESVLDGAAAFLRAVDPTDRDGLEAYAAQVLGRFPHVYRLGLLRRSSPVDATEGFQLTPILVVPTESGASDGLGADVDTVAALRAAAERSLRASRPSASELFALRDGALAYMLFQPVLDPDHSGFEALLISLLIRVADLLPTSDSLSGLELRLQSAHEDGDRSPVWLSASDVSAGALERALFPVLQQRAIFGTEAQPFALTVRQQLGWWVIDPLVAVSFALAAGSALIVAVVYGRARSLREDERRACEQRLYHMANYDSLTGLPNRNLYKDRLQQALARARRRNRAVALLFLDLDGFKAVNDTAGHEAGDRLLKMVADRLRGLVREQDTVARLAGDEFVVLLEDVKERGDAERVLQQLRDVFIEPFEIGEFRFMITASIGLALYPEDAEDGASLLRRADERMYMVKHPEWVGRVRS